MDVRIVKASMREEIMDIYEKNQRKLAIIKERRQFNSLAREIIEERSFGRQCRDYLYFKQKVRELIFLADEYLDFLKFWVNKLEEKEFWSILAMSKNCLYLNVDAFKYEERKIADFRKKNQLFEDIVKNRDSWEGIKILLHDSKFNRQRERYRDELLLIARVYVEGFNNSQLLHLGSFLPIDLSCKTLQEARRKYVRENSERIRGWATISVLEFEEWCEQQDLFSLKQIDAELASLVNKRDFVDVEWQITHKTKKHATVRRLRFTEGRRVIGFSIYSHIILGSEFHESSSGFFEVSTTLFEWFQENFRQGNWRVSLEKFQILWAEWYFQRSGKDGKQEGEDKGFEWEMFLDIERFEDEPDYLKYFLVDCTGEVTEKELQGISLIPWQGFYKPREQQSYEIGFAGRYIPET